MHAHETAGEHETLCNHAEPQRLMGFRDRLRREGLHGRRETSAHLGKDGRIEAGKGERKVSGGGFRAGTKTSFCRDSLFQVQIVERETGGEGGCGREEGRKGRKEVGGRKRPIERQKEKERQKSFLSDVRICPLI